MDAAGWCAVADVLDQTGLCREDLEELVRSNNKQRLQLRGEQVRACQGHSSGVPVTQVALEGSWALWTSDESVWHGTSRSALESIAAVGLIPQKRTHVHLTESKDSTVAKRAHVEVTLEIDPRRLRSLGTEVYRAQNGVLLARQVPPACVVALYPLSRATRRDEESLRRLFGLKSP